MNFKLSLTTGETFNIVEDQNKTLKYIIKNYILNKIPNLLIEAAVVDGRKLDINKTLFENKVKQNFNIVIYVAILPRSKINKLNISRIYFVSTHINQILQFRKCLKFIVDGCKVPLEMLDLESKYFENWRISSKSGPPGYLKTFFPPVGWIDIGLKAWNLYDNGNNIWLTSSNVEGEWYIAYHPIKTVESIIGILRNGFRKGPYTGCKHYRNINPLTNKIYPLCGEGVYFIPDISEVNIYAQSFSYLGGKFKVAFMCRINPYKVRIADLQYLQESWIVNGDALHDPCGRNRDDEVRPYKLLVLIEK